MPKKKVIEKKKPGWAGEKTVIREMTPQLAAAIHLGWIPIDTDPIDKFTPWFFNQPELFNGPKKPVVFIRKPNAYDEMIDASKSPFITPEQEAVKVKADKAKEKARKEFKAAGGVLHYGMTNREYAEDLVASLVKYVEGWENLFDGSKKEIPYTKDEDGRMSSESLKALGLMPSFMASIYIRIRELLGLSAIEVEGLESSPASVTA